MCKCFLFVQICGGASFSCPWCLWIWFFSVASLGSALVSAAASPPCWVWEYCIYLQVRDTEKRGKLWCHWKKASLCVSVYVWRTVHLIDLTLGQCMCWGPSDVQCQMRNSFRDVMQKSCKWEYMYWITVFLKFCKKDKMVTYEYI